MFQEEGKSGVSFFTSYRALFHVGFKGRVQMWLWTLYPPFTENYNFVLKLFVSFRDTFWPLGSCILLALFFFFIPLSLWLPRAFYTKLFKSSKHRSLLCTYMSSIDLNVLTHLYSPSFLPVGKEERKLNLILRFSTPYMSCQLDLLHERMRTFVLHVFVLGCLVMWLLLQMSKNPSEINLCLKCT